LPRFAAGGMDTARRAGMIDVRVHGHTKGIKEDSK
jgi:hypothetical protein